ncbi:MAG: SH3 domain-containing protein [Candidatus Omnitrophota bacterium]
MPLRSFAITAAFIFLCGFGICAAEDFVPFRGTVTSDGIHIRSDSTVTAPVICDVGKGDSLDVLAQLYEWYRVRLPRSAPSFIRKDLVTKETGSVATIIKERVNVRLEPNESSPIIGRAVKGEEINIVADAQGWYKIEPVAKSSGWIHRRFVQKAIQPAPAEAVPLTQREAKETHKEPSRTPEEAGGRSFSVEGIVRPQGIFFNRKATHKIVDSSGNEYLLRCDKQTLNQFNNYRVRLSGTLRTLPGYTHPLIEVKKIEYLE